jgi:hypothetical protein
LTSSKPGGVFELGLLLGDRLLLALEQFLGRVAPRAEVVFVEHHQVPIHRVQPLVLGLDVPRRVAAEQVLKGTEIDHRLLAVNLRRVAAGAAREVLPAVEVHVVSRSVCQASSTAGLKVSTSTRLAPSFLANW